MKRRENSCWKAKTFLEKVLIIITAILLCFDLALFVVLLLNYARRFQNLTEAENTTTCMTPQCVQAAAQIMDFIDPSINPCNNFYDFTCGTFLKKSMERKETNTFSRIEEITANRIEALITAPTTASTEKPLQLQRQFYKSCMNTTAIDNDNNDYLIDLIVKVGDWPLRQGRLWNELKFDWLGTMVKCRNLGVGYEYFMRISATEETINGTEMMLLSINPPKRIHLPPHLREYYVNLMTNISFDLGAIDYLTAKEESYRVLAFEDQIQAYIQDQEENGFIKIVQVAALRQDYPTIPWVEFLNNITITSVPFTNDSWINFGAHNYLYHLIHLINQTSKSIQANYVIWKLVESYANYWNEGQRTRYNSFIMSLNRDLPINSDRKMFCLSKAKDYFPSVAEVAYVKKYVQPEVPDDIKLNQMLREIKKQLIIRVKQNDWLDDKSKISAEAKLKDIRWLIGASHSIFRNNSDKIVNMEKFDLNTNNVVEMTQKLYKRRTDNYFTHVNKNLSDVISEVLDKSPILETNAIHVHKFNTLVLFAPLLQSIVYNADHPQYMNYGALGSMIGHEFTHSLLSQRSKKNSSDVTWPTRTRQEYETKIDCLIKEYQNYTLHLELTNDGTAALAENLADFVGPNLAYKAYQKWMHYKPKEENLPGLNYTPNQMFWIMFGVVRCQLPRLNDDNVYDADHGIPSFAVSFSVKNSPDFVKDFNCSVNSPMNPEKKCQIL